MLNHLFKYSIKKAYNLSLNIKRLKNTIKTQNVSPQSLSAVTGSSSISNNNTNISITNDLTTKYESNDIEKVLDLINKSSEAELLKFNITKGRVQKIGIWKRKYGDLTTLDDLLDLDGFGIKVLDRLINSILDVEPAPVQQTISGGRSHSYQFTVPSITNEIRGRIKNCTAIHIGISSVTWAQLEISRKNKFDQPTVLKNWQFHEIIDNKLHLIDLINNCKSIVGNIPESDCYIFESPRNAQQTSQGTPAQININTQMSQLTSIIAFAMANRSNNHNLNDNFLEMTKLTTNNSNNVLFLRQFLSARLFGTIIGNERISTSDIVCKLFEWQPSADSNNNIAADLFVADEQKSQYRSTLGYGKEYMGQSLLMALTFIRLCLIHCPKSLTKIGLAPKN